MILTVEQSIYMILVMALITFLTRALPFIIFPGNKKTPKYIQYLGEVLPYAIIGMLIVYCLKDVKLTSGTFGLPECIAIIVIAFLHFRFENTLLSIGIGTVLYMILVQFIFVSS